MFLSIRVHSTKFILSGRRHFARTKELETCDRNKTTVLIILSRVRKGSRCLGVELSAGNVVITRVRRRYFLVRSQGSDQHEYKNVFPGMTTVNLNYRHRASSI